MKIRNSFVSNSSSSSFIVLFPHKPKTIKELQKLLFGDRKEYVSPFYPDEYWPTEEIAEIVFNDIGNQSEIHCSKSLDKCLECLDQSDSTNIRELFDLFEQIPDYPCRTWKLSDYERKRVLNHYHEEKFYIEKKIMAKILELYPDAHIEVFEYADDTALGSAMEHGNLFRKLPNIRIGHH